jgi:hypothetical protein
MPYSIDVPEMLGWETGIPVGYFSKDLNEGVLYSCHEVGKFG